ncbi:MAG: hypothetical protein A2Z20_10165 [Bdellovibrionales bacterium RBG_16_40_8]|nr:MAG: hypothetical protein A2Z20_10165 [Bdellovibrionales bacterium RBG_16_40_8]
MKAFNILYLFIFVYFFTLSLFAAEEFIYRPPQMSRVEFLANKAAHPTKISYDDYLSKSTVSESLKENLNNTFLKAQEVFLQSEILQIDSAWQDVVGFSYKADWAQAEREMIQIAYLRLAQTATNTAKTHSYLLAAIQFDSTFAPDSRLFPPPIIEQYKSILHNETLVPIDTSKFSEFTIMLINGVRFNLTDNSPISLHRGTKRITLISPTYEPVTRILKISEHDANAFAFFQPQKKLLKIAQSKKMASPISYIPNAAALETQYPAIEQKVLTSETKVFYKKPKFWLGAALVTGIIVAAKNWQNDKQERSPTHREGF